MICASTFVCFAVTHQSTVHFVWWQVDLYQVEYYSSVVLLPHITPKECKNDRYWSSKELPLYNFLITHIAPSYVVKSHSIFLGPIYWQSNLAYFMPCLYNELNLWQHFWCHPQILFPAIHSLVALYCYDNPFLQYDPFCSNTNECHRSLPKNVLLSYQIDKTTFH